MEFIKEACSDPSPYSIEIHNEEELEIIKEALDSLHEHLLMVNKDYHEDDTLTTKLITIEEMCQKLKVPGYEWS